MKIAIFPFGILVFEGDKVIHKEKFSLDEAVNLFITDKIKEKIEELKEKYNCKETLISIKDAYKQFFDSFDETREYLNKFFIKFTSEKIKRSYSSDKIIIQLVKVLESLNVVINNLYERAYELYGYYFPEFTNKYRTIDSFIKMIKDGFYREIIREKYGLDDLMGFELPEKDVETIKEICEELLKLNELRDKVEKKIKELMEKNYKNLSKVATPLVGAKLLELAGGIEALAKLPSSTVQVLGAEKALFRHLTRKTKPPKHGVILQHPLVASASKKLRGKVARTLASKISIAAKVDFYKGEYIGDKLLEEVKKRVKEIRGENVA